MVKQALHHVFETPQCGDILMDTDADDWAQLQKQANDRDAWRLRVKQVASSSTRNWQQLTHSMAEVLRNKLKSKTRFHIVRTALQAKMQKVSKKAKQLSNVKAREAFYQKYEAKYKAHAARANFFKPKWGAVK